MLVSLIIPTLNEISSLPLLYQRLLKIQKDLKSNGDQLELVFVDDGSNDGTPDEIRKNLETWGAEFQLIERKERGLATAVLLGFDKAKGDILGVIDSDGSHPPELIPKLLSKLEGADLVIASRHLPGGGVEEWPLIRQWCSRWAAKIAWPLYGDVTDPMSGYFFLKRSVIEGARLNPLGYKILLEILVKGKFKKFEEVAYIFRNRDLGKSKMNWKVIFHYGIHLVKLYIWKLGAFKNDCSA